MLAFKMCEWVFFMLFCPSVLLYWVRKYYFLHFAKYLQDWSETYAVWDKFMKLILMAR